MSLSFSEEIKSKYKQVIINRAKYGSNIAYSDIDNLAAYAIERHLMDLSTGTLREYIALWLSDSDLYPGQHDYDGIRDGRPIECKPILITDNSKNYDGRGKINDHSMGRHLKYIEEDLLMQPSFFIYGMCAAVIEFPYRYISDRMLEQIQSTKEGRVCGKFTYKDWFTCPDAAVPYINKDLIIEYKKRIVGGNRKEPELLYKWLLDQ